MSYIDITIILYMCLVPELNVSARNKACELLIVVDEPLFMVHDHSEDAIRRLVLDLVEGVNEIYYKSFFRGYLDSYYFYAKNIEILYDFCNDCNQTQTVFLNEFSKLDTSGYCLSILLTHRDFPKGVQGLAWRNTVCQSKYNTGFITYLNHHLQATEEDSVMTLAHEIGHNFGAYHDEDTPCAGQSSSHIMGSSGSSHPEPQFSQCSLKDMLARMQEIQDTPGLNCFVDRVQDFTLPGFCGNHVVEPGEHCDCGLDYYQCRDPCCYPGYLTDYHREDNKSARSCHLNTREVCMEPFNGFVTYGLILPWSFISVLILALSIGLTYDWQKKKLVYIHLRKKEEVTCKMTQQGSLVSDIIRERWGNKAGGNIDRSSGGVKDQINKMGTAQAGSKSNIVKQDRQSKLATNGVVKYSDVKSNSGNQNDNSSMVSDRISFFSSTNNEADRKNPAPKIIKQSSVSNPISSISVGKTPTNLNTRRPATKSRYTPVPQRPAPKPPC